MADTIELIKHLDECLEKALKAHSAEDGARYEVIQQQIIDHRTSSEARHQEILAKFTTAFPDGDPDGHRRAHELWMEREIWKQSIRNKVLEHMAEKGVWAFVAGLSWLCWYGLQVFVKQHLK